MAEEINSRVDIETIGDWLDFSRWFFVAVALGDRNLAMVVDTPRLDEMSLATPLEQAPLDLAATWAAITRLTNREKGSGRWESYMGDRFGAAALESRAEWVARASRMGGGKAVETSTSCIDRWIHAPG